MPPFCKELEAKLLGPLDFSYVHGYPHEFHYDLWKKHATRFYENPNDYVVFVALSWILLKNLTLSMKM
jgi:hypothetical protein